MDGRVMAFVFYMAKSVGIRIINAENVSAIQSHPHYVDLIKFIQTQGYQITHGGTYEVFPLLPIKRDRWLATFHHQSIPVPPYVREGAERVKFPKISFGVAFIGMRDCVQKFLSEEEKAEMTPCVEAILALSDPKLLPRGFEKHHNGNIVQSRTMNEHNPLGGAMASYGSQHLIPKSLLLQRGLFTALFKPEDGNEKPRYFTPWEFMAAMYWPKGVKLPADVREAWKAAGNAIAIPHVVLCLYKMHGALRDFSPLGNVFINLKQMLQVVDNYRLKLSNVKQVIFETRSLIDCTDSNHHHASESPPGVQKIINHSPVVSPNVEQKRFVCKEGCSIDGLFDQYPMVDMMDTLRTALKHSGVEMIWPMSRVVMFSNPINAWSKTTVVPHHYTIMEIIKVFLEHAKPRDFSLVKVNGHHVTPSSIIPGLAEAIVAFVPVKFAIQVATFEGKGYEIMVDVTYTIADVKGRLQDICGFHPDSIDLSYDDCKIEAWKYVALYPNRSFKIIRVSRVVLPMDIPTVPMTPKKMIPPEHSDVGVPNEGAKIRFAARHPVWSSVRTVVCGTNQSFDDVVHALFPDLKSHCVIKVGTCLKEINGKMMLKHIAMSGDYEIVFDSSKPYPVTRLELVMGASIVDQMKIGTKEIVPSHERVERWIRSPFQTKAYPKIFSKDLTLTRLSAMYFAHSEAKHGLLTLVNGKCCDPRTTLGEIDPNDVITIRTCPLVGGAKEKEKDKDVKNMLHSQLTARGVPVDLVDSRVEAIMAIVSADRFRTHIAESHPRQWVSIKALANEARFRLITTEELKGFQNRKKDAKPMDSQSEAASSSIGSSVSTKATSGDVRKLSLDEIQIDLTYFQTKAGSVKQLSQESFGPDAEGVAIMHAESAKKFPVCRLSPSHLAIIAVGKSSYDQNVHLAPAINGKGQAILVPVCIYNYGDEEVHFNVGPNKVELNIEEALVVEFTIVRQEVENWDVVKSPLVYIGQSIAETKNAKIMTSWAVKAFGKDKRPCDHGKADYIHGFLRILESKADVLLARSGWAGIYLVPKNASKKPHEAFTIVHVPNKDIDEMKALAQSTKHALGIVRTSQGLALRSRREHAYNIKKAVFPELPLVEEGSFQMGDKMYILKHLQAHTSTDQLSTALQKLGWDGAKALKPVGPDAWSIAAPAPPPTPHLCINQHFVVITEQGSHGKLAHVDAPKVPPSAAFVVNQPSAVVAVSPVVSRFDEIKVELQNQVKAMVEEKIGETNQKVQGIQQSIEKTQTAVDNICKAQQATEAKVKEVEVSVQSSSQNILTQITSMISSLQNGLNSRLDKLEENTSEKDPKRMRQA
eukprot:symbB.v1.2.000375.t1/scaffold17.1/size449391/12